MPPVGRVGRDSKEEWEEAEGGAEKEREKSYLENSFWPFLVNPSQPLRPTSEPPTPLFENLPAFVLGGHRRRLARGLRGGRQGEHLQDADYDTRPGDDKRWHLEGRFPSLSRG